MGRKLTNDEFLERANKTHNFKFTYPDEYINGTTPLRIRCPTHDYFYQLPGIHLKGFGCKKCSNELTRYTVEKVKEVLNQVHNFRYDYDLITSVENLYQYKLQIKCKKHGIFEQRYLNHRQGCGCPDCAIENQTFTKEEILVNFAKKHGKLYDYSDMEYVDIHTHIKIKCKKHGYFWQQPRAHYSGSGCKECVYDELRITWVDFLQKANKIHNFEYEYPEPIKINRNTDKVLIKCLKHDIFDQSITSHLQGNGCSKCSKANISKSEIEVQDFIKSLGIEIITNKKNIIHPLELDIFIPSLNKAIEFNGVYWHYSEKYFVPGKHATKSNLCRDKNIKLLHIREDLWKKDQEKMKKVIINFLT